MFSFLMLKTLVVCLHNWKEEAGNGRKAILLTLKVLLGEQNEGKTLQRRFSRVFVHRSTRLEEGGFIFGVCIVTQSCLSLCDPMDCSPPGSSVHGDSPGKNTGVGCHVLLQGIFPPQGLNPGLPHCRWILYHLSHQGSFGEDIKVKLERWSS